MTRQIFSQIEALPVLPVELPEALDCGPTCTRALKWKRAFDFITALLMLAVLLPLMVATIVAAWGMQGRPIFVRHRRIGQSGKSFDCLKFRTMVVNSEDTLREHLAANPAAQAEWTQSFKLKVDPRVTQLGGLLRKSSLDELPQLLNILRGDMSAVGPRPIVADEVSRYGLNIADYYRVKPGLTGLWQISGRSNTDYQTRVSLDVQYASHVTLMQDLKILAMTLPAVLQARGSY